MVMVALHVAALITDTPAALPAYTVPVFSFTATGIGNTPTVVFGGVVPQPVVCPAWQVRALIIETALLSASVT